MSKSHDHYSNALIQGILDETKIIAMVGASANWKRPSYFAMKYLQGKGFRVIPVNPREAGNEILGETCYAGLADVAKAIAPAAIDMVDIFRNSEAAGAVTDEAIALLAKSSGAKVIWMQLEVRNDEAAARAEAAGLTVIMNRCPKIEYSRLHRELGWSGINTGVISSRRRKVS